MHSSPPEISSTATSSQAPAAAPDLANLKAGGFIKQRQKDLFTVRVKTPMGALTVEKLRVIAEAAERFGSGQIHLSVRQTPEIIGVPFDKFDDLVALLAEHGMAPASCGPRVRAVTGCSGCKINPLGLVDTQALGAEADARFFGTPCHGKFKITFSGCTNDCTRAKCADLGFVGMVRPGLISDACTACGLCMAACREGALSAGADGKPVRDLDSCTGCADCVRVCPDSAMIAAETGFAVYAGGKHGRRPRTSDHVGTMLATDDVPSVIEGALEWYQENGGRGMRLGHVIDKCGVEAFKAAALPEANRVAPGAQLQTGGIVR
jgi:dissimilatory sulfite reductase (desulfoviridin) alpha/beta subunit